MSRAELLASGVLPVALHSPSGQKSLSIRPNGLGPGQCRQFQACIPLHPNANSDVARRGCKRARGRFFGASWKNLPLPDGPAHRQGPIMPGKCARDARTAFLK
jgi:hypothetical protein